MAIRLYRAPSSRCWPLQADVLTIIKPGGNHSMSAGGVGLPPGVTTTTDGTESAGAGTAGGGLAADGRNLRTVKNGNVQKAQMSGDIVGESQALYSFALPAPRCGALQPAVAACSNDRRF